MARTRTVTGGRAEATGVIPGRYVLSVGMPSLEAKSGFRWIKLSDLARLESGHTPSRSHPEYWDGNVPWIGIRDATANHGLTILETQQSITEEGLANSSARLLPAGTVCLSRTASVGYVVRMGTEMATSQDFVNWVCGPELSSDYLKYILMLEQESVRRFSYGTTHQTMYYPEAKALHVCVPARSEQDAIVGVLGALDDKIAANRKLSTTAQSLLAAHFTELQFDVDHGEQVRLDEYFELNPKCAKPASDEPTYLDMHKLPTSDVLVSEWERRPAKSGARFMNGDTLLARITPCLENGKAGYVDFLDEGDVALGSTEYVVFRARPGVPSELAYFLITSSRFRTMAIQHLVGTSGRQRLSANDVAGFTVRRVDSEALMEWGQLASPLLDHLGSLRDENRTLAAIRDALLPRLMSGELRVRDAEAAVADVL